MQHISQRKLERVYPDRHETVVPKTGGEAAVVCIGRMAAHSAESAVANGPLCKMTTSLHPCLSLIQPVTPLSRWNRLLLETQSSLHPRRLSMSQKQNCCLQHWVSWIDCHAKTLTSNTIDYKFRVKESEENILHQTVSLKNLDATIICPDMESKKLKTDSSCLCKANNQLWTQMRDSGNMHIRKKTESPISTICTHLLGILLQRDKNLCNRMT